MFCHMPVRKGIVVPCYNEGDRIETGKFRDFVAARPEYFVCFVNDGSTDHTKTVLHKVSDQSPGNFICLNNELNLGKGESVRKGLNYLNSLTGMECIGFLDADLATSLDTYHELTEVLHNGDFLAVFASRIQRLGAYIERSDVRHIIGRIFATMISRTIEMKCYDTQCGAKVFKNSVLDGLLDVPFLTRWLFDVEIILRMKEKYTQEVLLKSMVEHAIPEWIEKGGSKISTADIYRIPLDLLKIRRKLKA